MSAFSPLTNTQNYGLYANLSASGLVKTGTGNVTGLVINSQSSGTVKLWDNTAASGSVLFNTMTLVSTDRSIDLFGAKFLTGLYVTIGGTADITVIYN